jgi:pimeloyl-ACP methyl ester carboxylesterase
MQVSEVLTEKGVVEQRFHFDAAGVTVPGIVWRPEGVVGPTPLVLLGHGGTQHKRALNVLGLARRFVRHLGATAVAIDAPGHGDRVADAEEAAAQRRDLQRRVTGADGVGSAPRPLPRDPAAYAEAHGRAAGEWSTLLDLLDAEGSILDGKVGYWGLSMGTMIGLPFVAADPRVRCAVLGLAGLSGWPNAEVRAAAARRLEVPVLFVFQWDDQLMTRESGLELFDALGSEDKSMHVFPGGHIDTPLYERDAYDAFFARHLVG